MPNRVAIIGNTIRNIEKVSGVRLLLQQDGPRTVLSAIPEVGYPNGFEPTDIVLSSDFDKQLTQLGLLYAFADAVANAREVAV